MKQFILAWLAFSSLSSSVALAHRECYTECWSDRWGHRRCETRCHSHSHPGPVPAPIDDRDLAISASVLAISVSTLAMDGNKQVIVNAAEDAAAFIETGRMTGTLAAMVQVAREQAAKLAGVENASELTEAELVDGILAAAEQALEEQK
jgi:hypothetical protein